ncbi:unnamed protein product [Cylicostephanus goldi]|uniref:Uncharacterized protein n=1 Tax=Cylicostephanus goldi TaxID=71465 RepID=A0A3P6SCE4_CYLGO|nr:unnamed protein product [Cylicostephanus goldi]
MWSSLWLCILSALACEVQGGDVTGREAPGTHATTPAPKPTVNRTTVKNAADFLPFELNGDVNLMADLALE